MPAARSAVRPSVPQVRLDVRALLAEYPALADDEELLLDTLEGQTDLFEVATDLVLALKIREAQAEGIDGLVARLRQRQDLLEDRVVRLRDVLIRLLEDAGLPKLPLDIGTLSLNRHKPAPIWPDAPGEDWDPEFVRVRREVNKTAIKDALRDERDIPPEIRLDNGKTSLTIRMR